MRLLIDTHIWIWWLTGQEDLPKKCRLRLDEMAGRGLPPCLAAISLWEAQMLASKGRFEMNIGFAEWLLMASDPEVVQILPIDPSVIIALNELPERFHGDPADRIIVATAKANRLPLMTMDASIRRSRIIEVV